MSLIQLKDLSFSYAGQSPLLTGLNSKIKEREKVAFIGPNGSGKTTLFMLISGILKPASGSIFFNNTLIKAGQFNSGVAYLFQNPDDQLFCSSVAEDVAFGPRNMKMDERKIQWLVDSSLSQVNLQNSGAEAPYHLSGGQKRLAALASILSMQPELLLLDEPVSNLDSKNRRQVITALQQLKDKTMIIASHDLEFLLETCDRCILLDQQKIIADRPIKDLLRDEKLLHKHELEKPHSLVPHTHHAHFVGKPSTH